MQVDTLPALRIRNAGETALVAETDAGPRDLLRASLRDAGYKVVVAASAEQLETALHARPLLEGSSPIAVVGVGLAKQCASALTAAAAQRARAGAAEVNLILTYEPGTLTTVVRPSLGPCSLVAIFEKPFDVEQIRDVVRTTRLATEAASQRRGLSG